MKKAKDRPTDWPALKLEEFFRQPVCPFCRSSIASPVGGYRKNVVGGRQFPAGSFRLSHELRQARQLRRCAQCGLIYQEWIPTHELLLALYASTKLREPWPPDNRRLTWKRALGYLPSKPGRLLDVGANDGHFLSLLPPGWERAALEPTRAARSALRAITDEIYEGFMDDSHLNIGTDSFDVICLFDVAEHFRDVKVAMTNLARCLKPGGLVMLETGNTACLPARIFKSMWWYYDYIEHLVFFNMKSLGNSLGSVNLQLMVCQEVVHTYLGGRFRMAWDLMRKMVQGWNRTAFWGVCNDHERIYIGHPFRVYWPDHMFGVAVRG